MTKFQPEYLKKWTTADPACGTMNNYMGDDKSDHYVVYAKVVREGCILSESNYDKIKECLEAIDSEADLDFYVSHWAVGPIDYILVHEDNEPLLREADKIAKALADYPILDEEDFSKREWQWANENWQSMNLQERIDLIKEHNDSPTAFLKARHDYIHPDIDQCGSVFEALTRI